MLREIVMRPWGYYQVLDEGFGWLLKRIVVNPGEATSLQYHERRDEHWIVVQGCAHVICRGANPSVRYMLVGDTLTVNQGIVHRIENFGIVSFVLIEVQLGEPDETDIVRLEDRYGRV